MRVAARNPSGAEGAAKGGARPGEVEAAGRCRWRPPVGRPGERRPAGRVWNRGSGGQPVRFGIEGAASLEIAMEAMGKRHGWRHRAGDGRPDKNGGGRGDGGGGALLGLRRRRAEVSLGSRRQAGKIDEQRNCI